ncbi:MAG: PGF-pre-PGF domain-containing protein [Candidatus Hadarchaeaceae archaeon]
MKNWLVCILLLVALSISSSTALAQPPPIPADYSGSVTVNGAPAPDGTAVFAKIEDYTSGSVTTSGGSYKYLLVEPPNDNYINKTVEFWVHAPGLLSIKAVPTDIFTQGTSHPSFNLTVTPTAATVTTNSATNVGTSSATLNASIGYGDYSSVDIQFKYRVQGAGWSYTLWSSGYTGASYSIGISGLDSDTTYQFEAEISFYGISVSGVTKTFTTAPVSPPPPPPTGDTTPPPTPSLISPADDENIIDNTPLLDWSDVSDPSGVTYDLSIAKDAGFTSIVFQKTDLTASTYEITSAEAIVDDTYYWHVRAVDGAGNVGSWSENWSFMVYVPPTLATLTADTTPIKASVYVDGALWGTAPQTKSVAAGTYTVSFEDLLGYLTPPLQTVTLLAGETMSVTGVYIEIPAELITGMTIVVRGSVENVGITIQQLSDKPAEIAIGTPGVTYGYLNIVTENITDADIDVVSIEFRVEKAWVSAENIDPDTISLRRWDPIAEEWVSLPTTRIGEDDTYFYYSSESPGLSIFAVSGLTLVPAQAEFELSNLVIDPSEVGPGETITISIVVTNVGELEGTYTVTLKINNVVEATEDVTLAGGATETVTFTVSRDVEGTYNVEVDGLTGTFVVTTPPPPPPSTTVPLAIAATGIASFAGVIGYFKYRQRKQARLRKTQLRRLKQLKKIEERGE